MRTLRVYLICSFSLLGLFFVPSGMPGQQVSQANKEKKGLSNDDIILMARVSFPDSTIIKTIQVNETNFDLSATALVALKNAGVSQAVIDIMLAAGNSKREPISLQKSRAATFTLDTKTSDLMTEVGVYVVQANKLISVEPEIVNWRTGGVLKTLATAGLDKGHVNGTIAGSSSKLNLASPPQLMPDMTVFYFHCVEGVSAAEFQLLRLWGKGDRREFRAITGGVLHATGGARDNVVSFTYEKIAPRIFKVVVPRLNFGEYGFLAPGAVATANVASQRKMYTFRIVE
jgi:hypothetical protein